MFKKKKKKRMGVSHQGYFITQYFTRVTIATIAHLHLNIFCLEPRKTYFLWKRASNETRLFIKYLCQGKRDYKTSTGKHRSAFQMKDKRVEGMSLAKRKEN